MSALELSNVTTINGQKRIVFVETGQLLAATDIQSQGTQSFYALVDDLAATPTISSPGSAPP